MVGGYDIAILIYEDWDLNIRLAAQYPFYYSGVNGTAYIRHGNGLSSLPVSEHEKWLKFIFAKNIHLTNADNNGSIRKQFAVYIELINGK